MKAARILIFAGVIVTTLAFGCTSVNRPLNPSVTAMESRAKNHTRATLAADLAPIGAAQQAPEVRPNPAKQEARGGTTIDDGYFVGVAISGGGSRSANFSAACLFELQRLGILQHVDYVSSVSGGSITAAYYCLSTEAEWNPENVQRRMTH